MINTETREVEVPITKTCDRCGFEADIELEGAEFLSYSDVGGYFSKVGDGTRREVDLCETCTMDLLGDWMRLSKDETGPY